MAFDGNGNWVSTFSAVADRDAGIKILASRFDNIFINDIAQSFENCLTKDGQVKTQVNFDVNNNRLINVVDPINDYDGANKAYVDYCIAHVEQDPLFAFKWADYIINDQSWLRADTFSWQDGNVYTNAYSHLVADIDGITPTTETVGSYTITYYPCEDGHKIVEADQESTVLNIYNESGVAWYYILDTTNQRFKLPRENPNKEILGQDAPVVTANADPTYINMTYQGGTTYLRHGGFNSDLKVYASSQGGAATGNEETNLKADLARTTGIFKGHKYLYFYVGQFTQTATEQTAGLNSELFNGKMDRDMSNMNASQTAKATIVGWGMPDYASAVSLTASPYTAPANGFIAINNYGTNPSLQIYVNDNQFFSTSVSTSGSAVSCFIPVLKNDIVTYSGGGTNNWKYFIPMKGVQNA